MSDKKELQVIIDTLNALINAPSCYAGLKDKAQTYLDAIGTADEAGAAKTLLEEVEADITPIDGLVPFAHSEDAVAIFGEEGAKKFAAHADELKASGAKYCDCAACTASLELLKHKGFMLKK